MANLPKKKVLDTEGNEVLPITHVSAVYDDNGTSVETLLTNMDEEIKNKIIEGYYIDGDFYNAPPITHDYVEIGGVKWATMNLGAESETDYGLYFQWGDTQGYTLEQCGSGEGQKYFDWTDYKYCDGTGSVMTKYNSTDNKITLDSSDDAATVTWGTGWRIPTLQEWLAMIQATNKSWTQVNNVYGFLCSDKTDSSKILFFPSTGFCADGEYVDCNNSDGTAYYLSNSRKSSNASLYLCAYEDSFGIVVDENSRSAGNSVRAVYDGPTPTAITPVTDAIYIDKATNTQYRWDGTAYVQLTKLTYTPTLQSAPTSSTTTYTKDGNTVTFEIGQFCRVANASASTGYDFYQLYDLQSSGSVAVWQAYPTTMGASGSSHAGGLVPDPGATAGTTKYLREDGTWAEISTLPANVSYIGPTVGSGATPAGFNPNTDTVHVTTQSLSAAQKLQARTNIEAVSSAEGVVSSTIRNIVTISQSDYDNLSNKVSTTLYIIV